MSDLPTHTPSAPDASQRMLAISIETGGVRACLIEPVAGRHRLIGWLAFARSRDATMSSQVAEACRRLGQCLGCVLWDEELNAPYTRSITPVHFPPVQQVSVAMSARAPVRVLLVGLTQGLSLAAGRSALASSPCVVIDALTHDMETGGAEIAQRLNQPLDAIVVVGGFDQRGEQAQAGVLALCRSIAQAVGRLPRTQRPPIVYAANRWAFERAEAILRAGDGPLVVEQVENVLPAPGRLQASGVARAISYLYWRLNQRIIGYREIARWPTGPGQPATVEANFIQLVSAWALQKDLSDLHAAYCTQQWRVHVWFSRRQPGAWVRFTEPHGPLLDEAGWPPIQLLSGEWPPSLPSPSPLWHDKTGLAPAVSSLGRVASQAMWDVLESDLLASSQ